MKSMNPYLNIAGNCREALNLDLSNVEEQDRLFNALAEGGNVTMPLADTFWGARFGMLTDRHGIQWLLNCAKG